MVQITTIVFLDHSFVKVFLLCNWGIIAKAFQLVAGWILARRLKMCYAWKALFELSQLKITLVAFWDPGVRIAFLGGK